MSPGIMRIMIAFFLNEYITKLTFRYQLVRPSIGRFHI